MSHPRRDTRASSSDTPEVPQASSSASARPLDVTRQQATSTEHTWQVEDYPNGPAKTESFLVEWRLGTEEHKQDPIPADWANSLHNRSAAAQKRIETMGPEALSAAAQKRIDTMQTDLNWNSPQARQARSEATRKGNETKGVEGRSAATRKAKVTRQFNKEFGDIIDLDGDQ